MTHLVHLRLRQNRLWRLAIRHRSDDDFDYVLHAGLSALLGDKRPSTFSSELGQQEMMSVLMYSPHELSTLRTEAQNHADPDHYDICKWSECASKPLPSTWPEGHRLGFKVRVCPTVRHDRSEQDVFLTREFQTRDEAYTQWLTKKLEENGAHLEHAHLTKFQLRKMMRKHARVQQGVPRRKQFFHLPDAVLEGSLTVASSDKFNQLLARGIGRHRGFGFGMLLIHLER